MKAETTLYHVSEEPDIALFVPRPIHDDASEAVVWALEERLLHNYLLPRDCPRFTCYTKSDSGPDEIARIIGPLGTCHLVAIKTGWLAAAQAAPRSTCTVDAAPFPLYR